MRRIISALALVLCAFYALPAAAEKTVPFDPFGDITILDSGPSPSQVILIASGKKGWKDDVLNIARGLANENTLVAGFDLNKYLDSAGFLDCPAGHFEALGKFVEKTEGLKQYIYPLLIGYAEGGTLVYVTLAEGPNNFLGAISVGFCPDFTNITTHFCKGNGLDWVKNKGSIHFLPSQDLQRPWIVFNGIVKQDCSAETVRDYLKQVPKSEFILAKKDWMKQVKEAAARLAGQSGPTSKDAIVEMPSSGHQDSLIIILSGDGGWVGLDRQMGVYFVQKGYSVLGFDCLRYFWQERTPEEAARDLSEVITKYVQAWRKQDVILVGYSMGADVLPFMINRMEPPIRSLIKGAALLGPSLRANFEIFLPGDPQAEDSEKELPLLPELKSIQGIRLLCIGGNVEKNSICRRLDERKTSLASVEVDLIGGGHMFKRDFESICELILQHLSSGNERQSH